MAVPLPTVKSATSTTSGTTTNSTTFELKFENFLFFQILIDFYIETNRKISLGNINICSASKYKYSKE